MSNPFPFRNFPPLKYAIAYGSAFLPAGAKMAAPVHDFILVIDDSKVNASEWHKRNMRINPDHYSPVHRLLKKSPGAFQKFRPSVFFAPLVPIKFPQGTRVCKCLVTTEADLHKDLKEWNEFYLAGRLQKPTLLFVNGDVNGTLSSSASGEFGSSIETNALNALRLSLLLSSDRQINLRDLIQISSSLSFIGDDRCRFLDDAKSASRSVEKNFLAYLHLYAPLIPKLQNAWKLNLEEGDMDILKGRYVPSQYGDRDIGESGDFEESFELKFLNPTDATLLQDILNSTEQPLNDYLASSYEAKLSGAPGLKSGTRLKVPKLLQEANEVLNARELLLEQSYTSEAHCSLYHSLPDQLQINAISASAKGRLMNIFNPFALLNSHRNREILGGPLPWERTCLDSSVRSLVSRSARQAMLKGLLSGPSKASLYSYQKVLQRVGC